MLATATSTIANIWFPEKQRALATAIGGAGLPLGTLASQLISGITFYHVKPDDVEGCRKAFRSMMITTTAMVTITSVAFFMLVREKPTHPPSAVANEPAPQMNLRQIWDEVKGNRNLILLTLAFSLAYGSFNGMAMVTGVVFEPFGWAPSLIALCGVMFLLCGVIMSIITGIYLDKRPNYACLLRFLNFNFFFLFTVSTIMFAIFVDE